MKIIRANTCITNYKVGDLIIRTKPVYNEYEHTSIDESYTNDINEGGPILITEIKKNGDICYQSNGGDGYKERFTKNELKAGRWLDGWVKYIK